MREVGPITEYLIQLKDSSIQVNDTEYRLKIIAIRTSQYGNKIPTLAAERKKAERALAKQQHRDKKELDKLVDQALAEV